MRAKRTYLLSEEEAKMLISINWPRACLKIIWIWLF